ncbi:uncharacterized protein N7458_007798 [Penicillium daleae]|uniref:Uncharacterized protein n=1 Tax=Penicillium daleae TaxID=63821 RepID=A0AAD6C1Q6_9EURO|nr:uncharacterized protein N7458_007798 [Penicillium daleae]KAJ5443926.1 hypothetical protein N7458_007798 [Penicillium daleae]
MLRSKLKSLSSYQGNKYTVKLWSDCKYYTNISFYVVFDSAQSFLEDLIPSFVNVVQVPDSFQPAHTKYKGSALEWVCRRLKLSETDWVLHLDEETEVNERRWDVAEDFGRFQLPVRLFKRPLLGWMHGSFILINGAVENAVTWETDCLAEDFWFAFHVCSLAGLIVEN